MDKVTINPVMCKSCELCIKACPKQILVLDKDTINAKGYHPAVCVDQDACVCCCACATMCPDCAITIVKGE